MKLLSTLLIGGFLTLSTTVIADRDRDNDYFFHSYKGQPESSWNQGRGHGKSKWVAEKKAYKKGYKDGIKVARKNKRKAKSYRTAYLRGYKQGYKSYDRHKNLHGYNYNYNSDYKNLYDRNVGIELASELIRANRAGEQVNINRLIEIPLDNRYRHYD
jgi:hypothetical protein